MIKLLKSKKGQYYFTICGKNGQTVVTSETYTRKADAKRATKNLLKLLPNITTVIDKT